MSSPCLAAPRRVPAKHAPRAAAPLVLHGPARLPDKSDARGGGARKRRDNEQRLMLSTGAALRSCTIKIYRQIRIAGV